MINHMDQEKIKTLEECYEKSQRLIGKLVKPEFLTSPVSCDDNPWALVIASNINYKENYVRVRVLLYNRLIYLFFRTAHELSDFINEEGP